MPDTIPAPPEGYFTLDHGSSVRWIDRRNKRDPQTRELLPLPGVLVWAEGAWKPVIGFRKTFVRTLEVDYAESTHPGATRQGGATREGTYMQRVAPERIAVLPEAVPTLVAMQEQRAADELARVERQAEIEAERAEAQRIGEAQAAAREAAMTPQQRLDKVRRDLAVGRELVEGARADVVQAQARLARFEDRVVELEAQEAKLAAAEGSS